MTLYVYRTILLSAVDGGTLDLRISLGFDLYVDQRIRLYGLNTPEMNSSFRQSVPKRQRPRRLSWRTCQPG